MMKPNPNRVSKSELARRLHCSRSTVLRHLSADDAPKPDRQGLFGLAEATDFLRADIERGNGASPEIRELRRRKLENEVILSEIAVKKARAGLIATAEIGPFIETSCALLGRLLKGKFEGELPPIYHGKTVPEIQQLHADAVDAVLSQFKADLLKI